MASLAQADSDSIFSWLDREHTVAEPGLQPLAGAAGGAVRASLHRPGLRLQRLQPAADQAARHHRLGAGRLEAHRARLDLQHRHRIPRPVRRLRSATGWNGSARARPCSRRPAVSAAAFSSRRWASTASALARLLGYGVLGGIGLGLGYISPVSTLIKWFPDRPGMATGMAIMGFGGGAMIGSPLVGLAHAAFRHAHSVGVAETFVVMGVVYFLLHDVRRRRPCACRRRAGSPRAMWRRRSPGS